MDHVGNNKGLIVKNIANLYDIQIEKEIITCKPRGKFRNENITPLVGDYVKIDKENKYILEIEPRKNELKRPHCANLDVAIIVTSLKEPNLSLNLLDKTISLIELSNIEPVIVFTKKDLLNNEEMNNIGIIFKYYLDIGYKVFYNTELNDIKAYLKNKTVVLTGQSGAGKSSLINKLGNYDILTNKISKALGRGVHTTRHVEIYKVLDINFLDTPGFSSLDLSEYTKEEIKNSFIEFKNYLCKFNNCMHDREIECGVRDAVLNKKILKSRYDNYISFIK